MNDATLWDVFRRSWRAVVALRGAGTPVRVQTSSAETMLLNSALQALDSNDLPLLMQSACHQLRIFSGADCTSVVLIDPDSGEGAWRIAAGEGWPSAVVGLRVDLPLRNDGALSLPRSDIGSADAAWVEPPLYGRHGLGGGLWVPIEHDGRTIGWMTAHVRDTSALLTASRPVATALAGIVGAALRRDRTLQDLRRQAVQARALCQQLPVLWMSIDGHSGTLLDCSAAIGSWLGRAASDCIGKPAAAFFETTDSAVIREALRRPVATGAEIGVSFRLKHRNGSAIDCVSDGALLSDEGASQSSVPRVLWVFHERQALQWGLQRIPDLDDGASSHDFDWTLEYDRERRQQGLRLLGSLRNGLHGLRCLFNEGIADGPKSGQTTQKTTDRARALLDLAWQASEKAAMALASPNERVIDLLSALQRLAKDISESTPGLCLLGHSGPVARLSAKARLAAFRTARDLLFQMVDESNGERITLQVDTTAPGFIRLRLVRQPQGDDHRIKPHMPMNPAPRGSLGLFGTKTTLAGVGGVFTIEPGQHGTIFAEFRIPVAAPAATDSSTRVIGESDVGAQVSRGQEFKF